MKEAKLYRFSRPILKIFTKIVFRPKYIGLENISLNEGVVLAGNHTNNLDCLLLISSTKRSVHFLAKDELWHGAKKIIFAHMGLIPVNRRQKDHNALVLAEKYLEEDAVIGIFPEGTTEKGRGLMDFKIGAVKMASDTNKVIVPFGISGKYRPFRKGLTIIFDKPYIVKKDDLEKENELLKSKINKLIMMGEEYGKNK